MMTDKIWEFIMYEARLHTTSGRGVASLHQRGRSSGFTPPARLIELASANQRERSDFTPPAEEEEWLHFISQVGVVSFIPPA
jgi:hypothetical protein